MTPICIVLYLVPVYSCILTNVTLTNVITTATMIKNNDAFHFYMQCTVCINIKIILRKKIKLLRCKHLANSTLVFSYSHIMPLLIPYIPFILYITPVWSRDQGQFGAQYFAQTHFNAWRAGVRNRTTTLIVHDYFIKRKLVRRVVQ